VYKGDTPSANELAESVDVRDKTAQLCRVLQVEVLVAHVLQSTVTQCSATVKWQRLRGGSDPTQTYLACAHTQWMHSLERLNDSAATQAGACCVNKVPLFDRFPFGPRHQSAPPVPKPSLADQMRTTSELAVSPLTV
jgi:hypothetical protein